jgi:hypothetical protein
MTGWSTIATRNLSDAMPPSLFTALSTYKPTESVNPEENFSTELLVHLLRHSLKKGTVLFSLFAEKLLQVPVTVTDYEDISIETQALLYTDTDNRAFPDITIKTKDRHLFIEVKVESGLNYYEIHNGENATETVHQIRKYQGIKVTGPKSVYLLTKHPCELELGGCDDFKKKFRWHDIHRMLKEYETEEPVEEYLIQEMTRYMEDKKMSTPKVTFELARGMEMLNALFEQMETALEGRDYKKSFGYEYLGYWIKRKNGGGTDENMGWVGNYYEGTRMVFEHHNEKVKEHIKKNRLQGYEVSENKRHMDASFDFEERRYFCLSAEEQVKAIKEWVDENSRLIEEYGG